MNSRLRKDRRQTSSAGRIGGTRQNAQLDPLARELVDNVAGVLKRSGYSVAAAAERLRLSSKPQGRSGSKAVKKDGCTNSTGSTGPAILQEHQRISDLVAHDVFSQILTWWWTDPQYCADGVPMPLPAKGGAPSIAALVRRLGRQYSLHAAMDYLSSTNSIQQVERLYIPITRWVTHRGNPTLRYSHHFRALAGFLRTLTHNADLSTGQRERYEYIADNTQIPVSKLKAVHEELTKSAAPFLVAQDSTLVRYERSRRQGERTVPIMIGVWVSEGGPIQSSGKARRRAENGARKKL